MMATTLINTLAGFVPAVFIVHGLKRRPSSLLIELTNICNANCGYCGYRFIKRSQGIMTEGAFKRIIDQYDQLGGGPVNLAGIVGDPLLDPNIIERIRYAAAKKNVKLVKFSTNGIALDRFEALKLLRSGVGRIVVDIAGPDRQAYKAIFGVDAYERVTENIMRLLNVNDSLGRPVKIITVIKYGDTNDSSVGLLGQQLREGGATVITDRLQDSWCGLISSQDLCGNMELVPVLPKGDPCSILFTEIVAQWDGRICACCRDLQGELVIGDVHAESLMQIWRGPAMSRLRGSFGTAGLPRPCCQCGLYQGLAPIKKPRYVKKSLMNALDL